MTSLALRTVLCTAGTSFIAACATVTPLGPDTYLMEGGTAVTAKRAEELCAQTGKKVLVTNLTSGNKFVFKCLDPKSPEYVAPKYETVPSAVIEDRRTK